METKLLILYSAVIILVVMCLSLLAENAELRWKFDKVVNLCAQTFTYMQEELNEPRSIEFISDWFRRKIEEEEADGEQT